MYGRQYSCIFLWTSSPHFFVKANFEEKENDDDLRFENILKSGLMKGFKVLVDETDPEKQD